MAGFSWFQVVFGWFQVVPRFSKYGILKVQSCKLYKNKYMIASTPITNTEIFSLIADLVFQLLSCKVLFMNRKNSRNC